MTKKETEREREEMKTKNSLLENRTIKFATKLIPQKTIQSISTIQYSEDNKRLSS